MFGFLVSQPSVHHESVVHGNADNAVHAAFFKFGGQFVVAWQVGRRASWSERAGQGEYGNGFAFEQVVCGNVYPSVVFTGVEYH